MQENDERLHWCKFNIMVRCFGIIAAIAGTCFVGWGIYHYYHPEEVRSWAESSAAAGQSFGPQTTSLDLFGGVVPVEIAAGLFALVLAVAVFSVRPYRPDLGDKASSSGVGARSWWTGEPKQMDTNQVPNKEDASI